MAGRRVALANPIDVTDLLRDGLPPHQSILTRGFPLDPSTSSLNAHTIASARSGDPLPANPAGVSRVSDVENAKVSARPDRASARITCR